MLQEENDALQSLVLDLAADKDAAKAKLLRLREQYNDLVQEVNDCHGTTDGMSFNLQFARVVLARKVVSEQSLSKDYCNR